MVQNSLHSVAHHTWWLQLMETQGDDPGALEHEGAWSMRVDNLLSSLEVELRRAQMSELKQRERTLGTRVTGSIEDDACLYRTFDKSSPLKIVRSIIYFLVATLRLPA